MDMIIHTEDWITLSSENRFVQVDVVHYGLLCSFSIFWFILVHFFLIFYSGLFWFILFINCLFWFVAYDSGLF